MFRFIAQFEDAPTLAKGLVGTLATSGGVAVSTLGWIEVWLRIISLLVGIAVGIATLISIIRKNRKNEK